MSIKVAFVLFVSLFYWGCAQQESESSAEDSAKNVSVTTVNDTDQLDERVVYSEEDIILESQSRKKKAPKLTLIASIKSPKIDGEYLSATYVGIEDNYAYITYHKMGSEISGAVDIVRINNPKKPKLISSASTADIDWNSVTPDYEQVAGNNRSIFLMGDSKKGATLIEMVSKNGQFVTVGEVVKLDGASGNSIVRVGDDLFATTGGSTGNGGTFLLDHNDLDVTLSHVVTSAKYGAVDGEKSKYHVTLIGGENGALHVSSTTNFGTEPLNKWPLGTITPQYGKNGVTLAGDTAFVALGDSGFAVLDIDDGTMHHTNKAISGTATNYVTVDGDYIFTANSLDGGFVLYSRDDYSKLGSLPFKRGNANHANINNRDTKGSAERYIYLANGTDGVKILKYSAK